MRHDATWQLEPMCCPAVERARANHANLPCRRCRARAALYTDSALTWVNLCWASIYPRLLVGCVCVCACVRACACVCVCALLFVAARLSLCLRRTGPLDETAGPYMAFAGRRPPTLRARRPATCARASASKRQQQYIYAQ